MNMDIQFSWGWRETHLWEYTGEVLNTVKYLHQVWLQYQCLWDMQAENIYNRLGEDLNKWQALLVQIRKARGTFDNAETRKEFGPVVIDYGKVRNCNYLL